MAVFKSKVHLACGSDQLRPTMNNVYFSDGYLYATDAHIVIKQSLKLHDFEEEEIKAVDGKYIHVNVMKELVKYDYLSFKEDHIFVIGGNVKAKFDYNNDEEGKYPNIAAVIPNPKDAAAIDGIVVSSKLLNILGNCMIKDITNGLKLTFYGEHRGIVVATPNIPIEDQLGIIMPVQTGR